MLFLADNATLQYSTITLKLSARHFIDDLARTWPDDKTRKCDFDVPVSIVNYFREKVVREIEGICALERAKTTRTRSSSLSRR